ELGLEEEADSPALPRSQLRRKLAAVGEAEVDQPHAAVAQDERVPRMHVPVQDALGMDRGVGVEQPPGEAEGAVRLAPCEQRLAGPGDVGPLEPLDREVASTSKPSLTRRWSTGNASTSVSSGSLPLARLKAMIASTIGVASANLRRRSAVPASMTRDGVRECGRVTA